MKCRSTPCWPSSVVALLACAVVRAPGRPRRMPSRCSGGMASQARLMGPLWLIRYASRPVRRPGRRGGRRPPPPHGRGARRWPPPSARRRTGRSATECITRPRRNFGGVGQSPEDGCGPVVPDRCSHPPPPSSLRRHRRLPGAPRPAQPAAPPAWAGGGTAAACPLPLAGRRVVRGAARDGLAASPPSSCGARPIARAGRLRFRWQPSTRRSRAATTKSSRATTRTGDAGVVHRDPLVLDRRRRAPAERRPSATGVFLPSAPPGS